MSNNNTDSAPSNTVKLPISRYRVSGRRVMVIYARDLADTCHLSWSTVTELVRKSKLRNPSDYLYDSEKEDFILTLSAAQAVTVIADTTRSWDVHHAISDVIQHIKRRK